MNKNISTTELKELQRNREGFALVNVLSESDFRKGSIPGSKNAPVDRPDFLESVATQTSGDKKRHVVVYCAGPKCDASTRAAKALTDAGYSNVQEYRGGMEEWNASSGDARGQQGAGSAKQDNRGPAGEQSRSQRTDAPQSNEKAGGQSAPKFAAQPRGAGASSSINRPPQADGQRGNSDANSAKRESNREDGAKTSGPGPTTGVPHPDVMQPQVRAGDSKGKAPETTAPKPAVPAQSGKTPSSGAVHESSSNP